MVLAALAVAGCGSADASGDGPRVVVQRYDAALARADAKAACAALTPHSREVLGEFGKEHLGAKEDTCQAALRILLRSPAGAALKRLGHARVGRATVRGDRAAVRVAGVDRPVALERTKGRWLIVSEPTGETD